MEGFTFQDIVQINDIDLLMKESNIYEREQETYEQNISAQDDLKNESGSRFVFRKNMKLILGLTSDV